MASRVTRSRRQLAQQPENQSRAKWTMFLTKVLADLMVEQVREGKTKNNFFNKKSWKYICDGFFKKTGLKWDKEQLKNRYSVLRRQYTVVKSLLEHSDFSWDESTGNIVASDEAWAEYIQEHADAEAIRNSGCPMYKQLFVIFSEPDANNNHCHLAELEGGIPSELPCSEQLNTIQEDISSESVELDDVTNDQDFQPTTPNATTSRKRGRKGIDDAIAGAISEMAAASKLRTNAISHCNGKYTVANCIKELDKMQIEEHVYFAAMDLFNSRNARETFLSLRGDKRLIWLHRKFNVHM